MNDEKNVLKQLSDWLILYNDYDSSFLERRYSYYSLVIKAPTQFLKQIVATIECFVFTIVMHLRRLSRYISINNKAESLSAITITILVLHCNCKLKPCN